MKYVIEKIKRHKRKQTHIYIGMTIWHGAKNRTKEENKKTNRK
jgi:hypothetical protein